MQNGADMNNVLVLNASYEILNITRWQRALCLIFAGKAEVLETGDISVHSPSIEVRLPSVIRMRHYVRKPRILVPVSRNNILMRDRYTCQYCGLVKKPSDLTIDHVMPRSLGGESYWENLVAACKKCNSKKGNRTPEMAGMKLRKKPRAPQFIPSLQINYRDDWEKYILYAAPINSRTAVN